MNKIELAGGNVCLYHADMRAAIKLLPDNSIDSVVCDPPYHLTSIVKRFGGANAAPAQYGSDGAFARASRGFMNKVWDGGDIAFQPETWAEVLRVLKPGGHIAAFGASRGYHRMACAIEDSGFEIRDSLMWIYGVGFPKSHDVSKGIDKALGAEGQRGELKGRSKIGGGDVCTTGTTGGEYFEYVPGSSAAREWEGFGTALKPAFEPIVLARKPLSDKTVAANVLRWGTGALNIDGCRVEHASEVDRAAATPQGRVTAKSGALAGKVQNEDFEAMARKAGWIAESEYNGENDGVRNPVTGDWAESWEGACKQLNLITERAEFTRPDTSKGRWPANVVHDGSDEVVEVFPATAPSSGRPRHNGEFKSVAKGRDLPHTTHGHTDNGGSAARFFYSAKASKADRAGSKHPTVKPVALMQWLVRLITPPGGTILDPFSGSGTTGQAAIAEGFRAVLIEREDEYVEDINRRLSTPQVAAAVAAQQPANDNQPAAVPQRDLFGEAA